MVKKLKTTVDKWLADPEIKKEFDKDYPSLVLSELILALMANDKKSVRALAKEVGLSPTVIQNLRCGKQADMKVHNFLNIAHACGYDVVLDNGHDQIAL